ncbi:MAG: DUF6364 family protein [Actinomycetota bacterium]
MTERTTVRLDENLLASARHYAKESGRTLTSLIEEGLHRVLSPDLPKKRKPTKLHTFDGGPDPNLTWDQIKKIMDEEEMQQYLERS